MEHKKILYITQEVDYFLPTSTISDFSKKMAERAVEEGFDIRVFTPRYGLIRERQKQLHDVIRLSGINIIVDDTDHPLMVKVASTLDSRLQVYFVDNDEFFKRRNMFGEDKKHSYSNAERSLFFIHGVMEAIKKLRWIPDIVHCIGWFSSFAPLYLKSFYKNNPCFENVKVIFSTSPDEEIADIGNNVKSILTFDKMEEDQIRPVLENSSPEGMRQLAIKWSDSVSLIAEGDDPGITNIKDSNLLNNEKQIIISPKKDNLLDTHISLYHTILKQ